MNAYVSVLKLRLMNGLQYRTAAIAGVATQFFFGFMFIMIFEAFYAHTTQAPPMSLTQLITYIWLQQAFLSFIMLWFRDSELFDLITTDRKSTRLNSSHVKISYAVFCLKKKK